MYGYDEFGRHTDTWTGTSKATATTHVEYVYDDLGRLREVNARRLNGGDVLLDTLYGYDARGLLVLEWLPFDETATYAYDALGRLRVMDWADRNGAPLASFRYEVDDAGHRTKVVESIDGLGRTIEYEYDDLYRLIQEKVTNATLAGNYTVDYYFDRVGNRLRKVHSVDGTTTYAYNHRDQLLTETTGGVTTTYGYDDNGSLTSKSGPGGTDTFTYDVRNRMIAATVDGIDLEYAYDHDGERVRKIAYDQGPFEDDLEEHYLLDKQNPTGYSQVLQVYNVSFNGWTRTFVIGHRVLMHSGTSATSLRILVHDGHGSVRGLFNPASGSNGAFVAGQVYAYDAFGVRLTQVGGTPVSSLLYAGEWWDNHLGRSYNRARWYVPDIGRFDAFDVYEGRVGEPLTLHKYSYAHANPIAFTDPSGESITSVLVDLGLRALVFATLYGPALAKAAYTAVLVTGGVFAVSTATAGFIEWGYLPQSWSSYVEAVQFYSGVGFVASLAAFAAIVGLPTTNLGRPPAAVPRLQRDIRVSGQPAPRVLSTARPVAQNQFINAEKNQDVTRLQQQGAFQVRVNQRQIEHVGQQQVVQRGLNRPDTQGVFNGKPTKTIEYDTRLDQLLIRRDRILANDPTAEVILKWFEPNGPNYTIVP